MTISYYKLHEESNSIFGMLMLHCAYSSYFTISVAVEKIGMQWFIHELENLELLICFIIYFYSDPPLLLLLLLTNGGNK